VEPARGRFSLKGLLFPQQVVELCESLHISLVWGMQKVYTSSKCNWDNLKREKKNLLTGLENTCLNHCQLEKCPRGRPLFHVLIFFREAWLLSETGYARTDRPLVCPTATIPSWILNCFLYLW